MLTRGAMVMTMLIRITWSFGYRDVGGRSPSDHGVRYVPYYVSVVSTWWYGEYGGV